MIYLGIDPDVDKSGVAIWNTETKKFKLLKALDFFDVLALLKTKQSDMVIIEAGWLIKKSNFHFAKNKIIGERIAKNVGANHQIGKLIEKFCIRENITYRLIKPKGKITSYQFEKLTKNKIKNQDIIDSAMLVFGY